VADLSPDVEFQPGDAVVLTGESWPAADDLSETDVPRRGDVVVIQQDHWTAFPGYAIGSFIGSDGYRWAVWPEAGHSFSATIIHRPSLGQKGRAS